MRRRYIEEERQRPLRPGGYSQLNSENDGAALRTDFEGDIDRPSALVLEQTRLTRLAKIRGKFERRGKCIFGNCTR